MSLLNAAAGNRSIFQSLAYNDTVPSFVPKIDINTPIDALQRVADKSDLEQSKIDAAINALSVRQEDEESKKLLSQVYKSKLNDISNLDSPYEQQRQVNRLANEYTTVLADKSKGLGHLLYTKQLEDEHNKQITEFKKSGDVYYDYYNNRGKRSLSDDNALSTGLQWNAEKDFGDQKLRDELTDNLKADDREIKIATDKTKPYLDRYGMIKELTTKKVNDYVEKLGGAKLYRESKQYEQQAKWLKSQDSKLTNQQIDKILIDKLKTTGYEKIFKELDIDYRENPLMDELKAKGVKQATQEPTADVISSSTTALSTNGALPKNLSEFKSTDKAVVGNVIELQKIIANTDDPVQKQQAQAQLFANQNIMASNNAQYKNAVKAVGLTVKSGIKTSKDLLLSKDLNGYDKSIVKKYTDVLNEAISRNTPITEDDIQASPILKSGILKRLNSMLGFTDEKVDQFNDYLQNNSQAQSISLQTIGITDKTKEALKQIPKTNFKQYTTDGQLLELPEELKPEDIEFKQMAVNNLDNKNASGLQILTADIPVYNDGNKIGTKTIYLTTGDSNTNEDVRNVTIKNLMTTNNEKNHEVAKVMANQKYVNEIASNEVKDTKNQRLSTYLPNKGMRVPYRINSISPNLKSYSVSIRGEKITFQNPAQLAEFFHKIDSGTDIPVFDNIEGGQGYDNYKDEAVAPLQKVQ